MDGGTACWFEEVEQEVHVDFAGEEGAGRRMDEEDAVDDVEGTDEEEVIGARRGAGEEAFEGAYETDCDCEEWGFSRYLLLVGVLSAVITIPFEAFLEFEEFPKGRVIFQ